MISPQESAPPSPPRSTIVVGLGNPGAHYSGTRHNVGFLAVDALVPFGAMFVRKGLSLVLEADLHGHRVVLAKPQTYMNRSGEAFAHLLEQYKCKPGDLVVIYDDVEIPFGHIRVRQRGSAAGHNGMKSVVQRLGTSDVPRVRIGVGRSVPASSALSDHVLQEFSQPEHDMLPAIFKVVGEAIALLIEGQAGKAMSLYNRRDVTVDRLIRPQPSAAPAAASAAAQAPTPPQPAEEPDSEGEPERCLG